MNKTETVTNLSKPIMLTWTIWLPSHHAASVKSFFKRHWGVGARFSENVMEDKCKVTIDATPAEALKLLQRATKYYVKQPWYESVGMDVVSAVDIDEDCDWYCEASGMSIDEHDPEQFLNEEDDDEDGERCKCLDQPKTVNIQN